MKTINAIIVMAGEATRFNDKVHKTIYEINEKPLFLYSLDVFNCHPLISKIILVCHHDDYEFVDDLIKQNYDDQKVILTTGGKTRLASVQNGLKLVNSDLVFIHDAARPLIKKSDLDNLINNSKTYLCGGLYHKIYDTIKEVNNKVKTLNRDHLRAISTPEYFDKSLYQTILDADINTKITDELSLFEEKIEIGLIESTNTNLKVTTKEDLDYVKFILMKDELYKIGHSFDFHPFEKNRPLVLGGVNIPYEVGLLGHSDADVVYHAVSEALIGALSLGDIGMWFPDNDPKYLNIASSYFLNKVVEEVKKQNYQVENIDLIIYLEKPNLKDYKYLMAQNLKTLTACQFVNVKATTMEKKGLIGKGEGIACEVVCLLKAL